MTDFALARAKMIASQVRPNGITDSRIVNAMAALPRELFVPEDRRSIAYVDEDVEIAPGRYLMEPMALARLVQLAEIEARDRVLHVGCGTGYATVLLASLSASVAAIDEDQALAETAKANAVGMGVGNVEIHKAPHAVGFATGAPYDVVLIDGRVPEVPQALLQQLKDGGRLVAVVGERAVATAMLFSLIDGSVSAMPAFEASVAPLPGVIVDRPAFVF